MYRGGAMASGILLTAVFLKPLLLVDAFGFEADQELFTSVTTAGLLVDALHDALLDRLLDGDAMQAPPHRIAVLGDVTNQLIEDRIDAAMSGDDRELATPSGN